MAFDLELARTSIRFEIKDSDTYTRTELAELIDALLDNKNLLQINVPSNTISDKDRDLLIKHKTENARAHLTDVSIHVGYNSVITNKERLINDQFKFDDPAFYEASRIYFMKFEMKENVADAEIKLHALKALMLTELKKCRHLKKCHFLTLSNEAGPFLSIWQKNKLKNIIYSNETRHSKYNTDWTLKAAVVYSLVGLNTLLIPGFGILNSLLALVFLPLGGVMVGGAITGLRDRFLFNVGYNKLQQLKNNTVPDNDSIKDSLKVGLESKHWKGYFNSFLHFKTYKPDNYAAYAAGLYTGVNRLKEQKEVIKTLRPN